MDVRLRLHARGLPFVAARTAVFSVTPLVLSYPAAAHAHILVARTPRARVAAVRARTGLSRRRVTHILWFRVAPYRRKRCRPPRALTPRGTWVGSHHSDAYWMV